MLNKCTFDMNKALALYFFLGNHSMNLQIDNKVYFVAGGSTGIGFGIAKALAENGANVFLGSRSEDKLSQALEVLTHTAGKHDAVSLDAASSDSIKEWVAAGLNKYGRIDGLVINAGGPPAGRFEDLSEEQWDKGYQQTLMSAVRLIQTSLPALKEQTESSIVAVTSSAIKEPIDDLLLSNVFRSGVVSLLKSLSRDLAKYNIRINNLVPGRFATGRIEDLNAYVAKKKDMNVDDVTKASLSEIPLGRYGNADEIGRAGAFLLSPAASYITGETLIVDGGLTKTVW